MMWGVWKESYFATFDQNCQTNCKFLTFLELIRAPRFQDNQQAKTNDTCICRETDSIATCLTWTYITKHWLWNNSVRIVWQIGGDWIWALRQMWTLWQLKVHLADPFSWLHESPLEHTEKTYLAVADWRVEKQPLRICVTTPQPWPFSFFSSIKQKP